MAEYFLEPQNPLKKIDETTGDINYIYPLTTDKQVIMENGERLSTVLNESILYMAEIAEESSAEVINADTLGGQLPSYYATAENGIFVYTHTKSDTVHSLIGDELTGSINIKFASSEAWNAGDTLLINNKEARVYSITEGVRIENEILFAKWVWVNCTIEYIESEGIYNCFFKTGGGLSNTNLALATATESDVLSDKTFYSGDKELKIGSYIYNYGTFTSNGTVGAITTVNVGFKPNIVICWCTSASQGTYWLELRNINGIKSYTLTNGSSYLGQLDGNRYLDISITDTGFELTCTEGWSSEFNYIACK